MGAATSATLSLADNDTATVTIGTTRDGDESGPINGLFTVSLTRASATDTVLRYTVGGTAVSGSDFRSVDRTAKIPAHNMTATRPVPVMDEALVAATQTAHVSL